MSVEEIILSRGQATGVLLKGTRVDFLLTGDHSRHTSIFEFAAAPGFDTGAHIHAAMEEMFYVLEGRCAVRAGETVSEAGAGTFVFIPPGTPHSIRAAGAEHARFLCLTSPPGHENYFSELAELMARPGAPDPEAIAAVRRKYDTQQLAALTTEAPAPPR